MSIKFIKKGGIDTSDATATAYDLAKNKTAYVKGQKITGKLTTGDFERTVSDIYDDTRNNKFLFRANYLPDGRIIPSGNSIRLFTTRNNLASYIGLTADKLKKDETILGVTGTYEGSGGEYNAKIKTSGLIANTLLYIYITEIPLIDTSNYTNMKQFFNNYQGLIQIPQLNTSNVTNMQQMFNNCKGLTTIPLLNTSKVTNMQAMFSSCSSLTTIPLLNTSNVTNMSAMFLNCLNLTQIPLLSTSNVTTMSQMFDSCTVLTTIPLLNTDSVIDMWYMFNGCNSLSNESLNNILAMCTGATSFSGIKTLKYIGITSAQATTCQGLSNYQAFLNAGWTTGY